VHRFATERAQLKVRNAAGEVAVETADVAETTVELVPLNDSDSTRLAIEQARIEARGDEILVELEGRGGFTVSIGDWAIGRAPKVGVRIRCPYGSDLDCNTASADVTATGRLGDVSVKTASGDVSLPHVGGRLDAKTASGDVSVAQVDGRAAVHTVSGEIDVGEAHDRVSVNAVSGDVVVGAAGGDVDVTTISGDHDVRAAGPGEVRLKAVSGDVALALRPGLRIRFDVGSLSGSIHSDLPVGDEAAASDAPTCDVRIRTTSGDVRIGRAQSSASESSRIALA